MEDGIPLGLIFSAFFWLFIVPIVAVVALRKYKRHLLGEDTKEPMAKLEDDLLKEIKESYSKLTDEQKKKIDRLQ
jgi:hypothetical protein